MRGSNEWEAEISKRHLCWCPNTHKSGSRGGGGTAKELGSPISGVVRWCSHDVASGLTALQHEYIMEKQRDPHATMPHWDIINTTHIEGNVQQAIHVASSCGDYKVGPGKDRKQHDWLNVQVMVSVMVMVMVVV